MSATETLLKDWNTIDRAVAEAKRVDYIACALVRDTAKLVADRLRISRVDSSTLRALKAELKDFNMHTGTWKGKQ